MDALMQALADPIRRQVLRMLRRQPLSAGAIAGAFEVSRPAVSRHLRVLREARLVRDEAIGRERVYRLDPTPLAGLEALVTELCTPPDGAAAWQRRFMALETEVQRTRKASARSARESTPQSAKRRSA